MVKRIIEWSAALFLVQVVTVSAGTSVVQASAGAAHSLLVLSDGSLWGMGFNRLGQLGPGISSRGTHRPVLIITNGVNFAAAGGYHTLYVMTDGSLLAMGYNGFGQLGNGAAGASTNQPELIVPNGVVAVAAGAYHSLFLKSDGSLWGMGNNASGELGDGTTNAGSSWKVLSGAYTGFNGIALSADGSRLFAAFYLGGIFSQTFPATPNLGIAAANGAAKLSWVVPSMNLALQSRTNLNSDAWQTVSNAPGLNLTNLQEEVVVPMAGSNSFFRLASP